jgi:hypothetical protein
MLCTRVCELLSEFYDGVLDSGASFEVFQHVNQCESCRKELESLSALHRRLRSLAKVHPPNHLLHRIQLRLAGMRVDPWPMRLKGALERRWSLIRTTEGQWYWTRAMGTIIAAAFFCLINIFTPFYMEVNSSRTERVILSWYGQQVIFDVIGKLGMLPEQSQKNQTSKNSPGINDRYLLDFGQYVANSGENDTLTVVTSIDPNGIAKIEDVLVYPADRTLLGNFNKMITTVPFRPARMKNGQAVPSQLIFKFYRISVSD